MIYDTFIEKMTYVVINWKLLTPEETLKFSFVLVKWEVSSLKMHRSNKCTIALPAQFVQSENQEGYVL